ncbi:MAG: hydroxyacylglutathione hydrolase [Gammaproteobacteria bacterium]
MPLELTALPAFADNYIWALSNGRHALVVDPGDAAVVEAWLAERHLALATILVTHHHADHTGGIMPLKARHGATVIGPQEPIDGIDITVGNASILELGAFGTATVIAVPGHTRGHVAYHLPAEHLLFAGDTLFSAGCGRLFEGTAGQMYTSLQHLAALPDETLLCCTHEYTLSNLRFAEAVEPGNPHLKARRHEAEALRQQGQPSLPVTMGRERLYNPFLRCAEASVCDGVRQHMALDSAEPPAVFAALRAWKDRF